MKNNTVTAVMISNILQTGKEEVIKVGEKTTVVSFTTREGFNIIESSSCVDPDNYDEQIGKHCCYERITNKLWELEGYYLQKELAKKVKCVDFYTAVGSGKRFKHYTWDDFLEIDEAMYKIQMIADVITVRQVILSDNWIVEGDIY